MIIMTQQDIFPNHYQMQTIQQQAGFNIVELMIAIVLVLIISLAASQSYVSSKATYRNTTQVSELQSNARFASYLLGTDINRSGNMGCFQEIKSSLNDTTNNIGLFDFSVPIQVWDFNGTDEGSDYTLPNDTNITTPARRQWRNNNDIRLPNILARLVVAGSDVIVTSSISENLDITLTDTNRVEQYRLLINGSHDLDNGQLVLVGNCQEADLFQHQGDRTDRLRIRNGGGKRPGNNAETAGWQRPWGSNDEVRTVRHFAYYIGIGANGLPALMRMNLSRGLNDAPNLIEELVENVYNMQVVLAEDDPDGTAGEADDEYIPDRLLAARNAGALNNTMSVKIGLLLATPDSQFIDDNSNVDTTYTLADSVTVTPANRQRTYYVLDRTIKLQNQGTGRNYSYETL